jgi:hypothetical protein
MGIQVDQIKSELFILIRISTPMLKKLQKGGDGPLKIT